MAAAAAIGLSTLQPLDVRVLLGGPDIDLMIACGKVKSLLFAFMGMGAVGLCPNFRQARERGNLEVFESSEYLVLAGLEAAARDVPYMPTRSGLATDVLNRVNTPYREIACVFTNEPLVAVPALYIDIAVLHVNEADRRGNCMIYGDVFGDYLLARAAPRRVWVTAERVVDELPPVDRRPQGTFISRLLVAGVIHAPGGSDFTPTYPDRLRDSAAMADYQKNACGEGWSHNYAIDLLARVKGAV
jgi:glutaconate CoA-transferase subunit A